MENSYKILLAEDEPKLSQVIQEQLTIHGFETDVAFDGNIAEKMFKQHDYSLVLLDINLPYKNGLALCKEFRETNSRVPIIMLTALGEMDDKINAFSYGADDYIVKPFHFDELSARIKVFLKRAENSILPTEKINIADMEIDIENKMVSRDGKNINLTAKEFSLLLLLSRNRGKVVNKQDILEKVWELTFDTGTNTIEVYISFLRNKIDKPYHTKLIHTKPGYGYYVKETAL